MTFPARQYSVNGERRSFALLRPMLDAAGQDRIRDLILQAYAEHKRNRRLRSREHFQRLSNLREPATRAPSLLRGQGLERPC